MRGAHGSGDVHRGGGRGMPNESSEGGQGACNEGVAVPVLVSTRKGLGREWASLVDVGVKCVPVMM